MTAKWIDLTGDNTARVLIHPRTGRDSMIMFAIRVKMAPYTQQYEFPGGWKYAEDFGYCLVQTDASEGLAFSPPDYLTADGETLAACFEDWLGLPDEIVQAWRKALDVKNAMNAPELLPASKADVSTDDKKKGETSI